MYRIVTKEALKPTVILYEIEAPMVAKKAQPGQFIILRVDENGERIPITIHDYDRETLWVLWASPPRPRVRKRSASSAAAWAAPLPTPF